ncbi:hypothetical protein FRC14_001621 [Serendipita sp. 396]|nr:hypothetical protein FRC14_001621 [Serendipita sp. 396]KAG8780918.1 hypothetical protein FRC15_009177 [Serendipita sp. 397]KAG8797111.1 hypothetical protein FRC16_009224 [Serendipita sp. 398]KAG8815185.1 hypothetical protein FRC19_001207 [Serendipita sp. 401]KAG9022703.1 hypothetical protein FS842_005954 [Serendipita sp. 407]
MSAYGLLPTLQSTREPLPPTIYTMKAKSSPDPLRKNWTHISVHHITLSTAPLDLVKALYKEFSSELERDQARTYPQEAGMTEDEFKSYFFARDAFVGIGFKDGSGDPSIQSRQLGSVEESRIGREWDDAVAGFYYVKPNYPGHSSHICNAGFVIPLSTRGLGLGYLLGESYLHYAPLLGYRGSIFNLVYADNPASLKIWDNLGFQRVGLVPGAGKRVKPRGDGESEETYYVDAHIIYKSFV